MIDLQRKLGDPDDMYEDTRAAYIQSKARVDMRKADYKPEVFFCGQIVGGDDFDTDDALFVEVILKYGPGWKQIDKTEEEQSFQTHTAYPDEEGTYVFAHPFSFSFVCQELHEW